MNWTVFIIIHQAVVLVLMTLACIMRVEVAPKAGGVFVAIISRGLITWGLVAAGASLGWTIALTALCVGDIAADMNAVGKKRQANVGDWILGLIICGGTIALAASAL